MLSFPLSLFVFGVVRAMCADSIFRLSLCNYSNERKHSTQSRHKKKHLFETRERFEKESRRFASPLQKTTTTTTTRAFEKTFSFVRTRRDFFVEEGGEPRAYTRALLKRERERGEIFKDDVCTQHQRRAVVVPPVRRDRLRGDWVYRAVSGDVLIAAIFWDGGQVRAERSRRGENEESRRGDQSSSISSSVAAAL